MAPTPVFEAIDDDGLSTHALTEESLSLFLCLTFQCLQPGSTQSRAFEEMSCIRRVQCFAKGYERPMLDRQERDPADKEERTEGKVNG